MKSNFKNHKMFSRKTCYFNQDSAKWNNPINIFTSKKQSMALTQDYLFCIKNNSQNTTMYILRCKSQTRSLSQEICQARPKRELNNLHQCVRTYVNRKNEEISLHIFPLFSSRFTTPCSLYH